MEVAGGEDLRIKAKQAMESCVRELLIEAIQVPKEYCSDFGASPKAASCREFKPRTSIGCNSTVIGQKSTTCGLRRPLPPRTGVGPASAVSRNRSATASTIQAGRTGNA